MKIQKIKDTFNDYRVELSWGQLNAIFAALEKDHADPLADELFAELGWYLQNVPGPGEDEEEYKEAREAEKEAAENAEFGEPTGEPEGEFLGQEVGSEEQGGEGDFGPEGGAEPEGAEPPVGPVTPEEEADEFLERPPEHAEQ